MKNELMARAIGEIDDDLIEEARLPFPKQKRITAAVLRYAAVAACFVVILTAALLPFRRGKGNFTVCVNGSILVGEAEENTVELPLAAAMQLRMIAGTEIPLSISVEDGEVVISAGEGSVLFADGEALRELTISGEAEIIWVVDVTARTEFELALRMNGRTEHLLATADPDANALFVTAYSE